MSNIYYVAGIPYSDELFHHGVKGQKWGIRRYQNEDGSLTAEGQKRYGMSLGEYANKRQGLVRKLVTGDWLLGRKQIAERLEARYERKAKEAKNAGRDIDAQRYEEYRKAQAQRNIDREVYQSHTSTGKMFAQNFLLGVSADSYRVGRQRQESRGEAAVPAILGAVGTLIIPGSGVITTTAGGVYTSKKRYGKVTL